MVSLWALIMETDRIINITWRNCIMVGFWRVRTATRAVKRQEGQNPADLIKSQREKGTLLKKVMLVFNNE